MMFICIARDSGGIRTHDPQLRRLLLYPTELRNHRQNLNELSQKFCECKINSFISFLQVFVEFYLIRGLARQLPENNFHNQRCRSLILLGITLRR